MTLVVWLILCAIWGTTWIFIKVGVSDEKVPPISFAAARFVLAAAIIASIVWFRRIPLPKGRRQWSLMMLTGILQFAVNYSLVFWSETKITSGLASVLQGMISVFGLGLAWYFLPNEKINGVKVLAVMTGLMGVGVIFSDQLQMNKWEEFHGSIAIVFGAFAAAQASILIKAKSMHIHPASLMLSQMIFGVPPLIAYGLLFEGDPRTFNWNFQSLIALLQLAILGTVVAFWLYYWLLSKIESTKAMMLSLVTPMIAVLVGYLARDEQLPRNILFGGLLILAGIGLILIRPGGPRSNEELAEIHLTV